jgi:tetratricopeptide (TPR) repeat protein
MVNSFRVVEPDRRPTSCVGQPGPDVGTEWTAEQLRQAATPARQELPTPLAPGSSTELRIWPGEYGLARQVPGHYHFKHSSPCFFGSIAMTRIVGIVAAFVLCASMCLGQEVVDYDKMIAECDEAIRRDSKDAKAFAIRGFAWSSKNEYGKAIADLNEALRLDPKNSKAFTNRGAIWALKGDQGNARADYSEALRIDPKDARAYVGRGICFDLKNEHDRAIADFSEALRLDSKMASAYANRGVAWSGKCEYDKSIADYDEAISLAPKDPSSYFNRAVAWQMKGDYDKAIADYTKLIALKPENGSTHFDRGHEVAWFVPKIPRAYFLRGMSWHAKGEYDKAIADFGEAIRLDRGSALIYFNRGITWHSKGEFDKAIADFDDAIRLGFNQSTVYSNRGVALNAKGEYDQSIANYDEAIRLDPQDASYYCNRGVAWNRKGAYDRAIVDYNEAIRLVQKDRVGENNLAWLLATCPDARYRNGLEAVKLSTKACEMDGRKKWNYLSTLAAANAESGNFKEAIKWQEKAIELAKDERDKIKGRTQLDLYQHGKPYREESEREQQPKQAQ